MGSRPGSLALVAGVVLATLATPAATGGAVACAAEGPRAGLVVDTGARVIEMCVVLDAAEVSGLRLIELASVQHGLSYGFGMGGAAVCRLDGVGPTGDDCFAEYPEYWGYWHGDGRGGWTWAPTGAGSYRVGDGDVEGWVWGDGDSGATHRMPPAVALDDICEPAIEPSPKPTAVPEPSPEPATSPAKTATPTGTSTPRASTDPDGPSSTREPKEDRTRSPSPSATPSAATSSTSSDAAVLAAGTPPTGAGGPPGGLFLAGGLAAVLGAGGWLRLRSRAKGTG